MHIFFHQSWFILWNEIRNLALRIPLQSWMCHFLELGDRNAESTTRRTLGSFQIKAVNDNDLNQFFLSLQEWKAPANRCFNENRCSATRFGSLPFNPFVLWLPLTFMDVILSSTFFKVYLKIWKFRSYPSLITEFYHGKWKNLELAWVRDLENSSVVKPHLFSNAYETHFCTEVFVL